MNYARANLCGLSGIPEWRGVSTSRGWQQSDVDARWAEIGQPAPAPLVPQTLIGWKQANARMPQLIQATPLVSADARKALKADKKGVRGWTVPEHDFVIYFLKVAAEPFHKQSGISKVAGTILKVAAIAIPGVSIAQGIATAGNMGLALNNVKRDQSLATSAMAPALAAQAVNDANVFQSQLDKLNALAPKAPSAAMSAQNAFASASAPAAVKKVSPLPWLVAAGLAAAVLIVVRR